MRNLLKAVFLQLAAPFGVLIVHFSLALLFGGERLTLVYTADALSFFAGIALVVYFQERHQHLLRHETVGLMQRALGLIGATDQISAASKDLAESSTKQLDNFNETASASNEIAAMVARTSDSAQTLAKNSTELNQISQNGRSVLNSLESSSRKLEQHNEHFRAEMQTSNERLRNLLTVFQQVSEKTKVINEIVFQTRLLSFNASVEAARAGEHGKGFAVVAEEVGNLASLSGRAANEISHILKESEETVGRVIQEIQVKVDHIANESTHTIVEARESADQCLKLFDQMAQQTSTVASLTHSIQTASEEQANGVNEINVALQELNHIAQRNDLAAGQSLKLAEELDSEMKVISNFEKSLRVLLGIQNLRSDLHSFEWDQRFVLGVDAMDDEHQILIKKIGVLVSDLNKPTLVDAQKSMGALAEFTIAHFKHEEEYMESIGYQQLPSHRMIHVKLIEQVVAYSKQLTDGSLDRRRLVSFLKNWLVSHIMGVDRKYGEFSAKHPSSRRGSKAA